jgi:hypothetical protein
MSENEDFNYDEEKSVEFIRNHLPQEIKEKFSDDDINYIVDLIYDFYLSKGYLDDDDEDEKTIDIDEDEIVEFVVGNAKEDGIGKFEPEEIRFIVQGELEYCATLDLFE